MELTLKLSILEVGDDSGNVGLVNTGKVQGLPLVGESRDSLSEDLVFALVGLQSTIRGPSEVIDKFESELW